MGKKMYYTTIFSCFISYIKHDYIRFLEQMLHAHKIFCKTRRNEMVKPKTFVGLNLLPGAMSFWSKLRFMRFGSTEYP